MVAVVVGNQVVDLLPTSTTTDQQHLQPNQRVHESGATPGHAFVQNLRRGHYELAAEEAITRRLPVAFDELALAI
jgi:hypothetical protein